VKAFSRSLIAALMLSITAMPALAQAVDDAEAWRLLAAKLDAGSAIDVRLRDGAHFKATFIDAKPDAILVQRKTRLPVPVEAITYESIASISRSNHSGMSAAKVTGIALGSAGAAIGAFFLILLASLD
jgi:hypothetical protein